MGAVSDACCGKEDPVHNAVNTEVAEQSVEQLKDDKKQKKSKKKKKKNKLEDKNEEMTTKLIDSSQIISPKTADEYEQKINKNQEELAELQVALDDHESNQSIENSQNKTPESKASEPIEQMPPAPEYNKLNTIMVDAIAQNLGTPTMQNQNQNLETTETYNMTTSTQMVQMNSNELSGAELAKKDLSELDETEITANRVENVVELTKELSVEEIPQVVFQKYKTLNLLPMNDAPTFSDDDADDDRSEHSDDLGDDEKEEIKKRKSAEMKKQKAIEEEMAIKKQMDSLKDISVNKGHIVILSGDDSELSPLPPAVNNDEKKHGVLKSSTSLFHLEQENEWDDGMVTKEKKEMMEHMTHLLTSHAQQSESNLSSSAGP